MKLLIRIVLAFALLFICIQLIMNLMFYLNKGNTPIAIMSLTGLIMIAYAATKTRLFTKFNFKKKE